MIGILALVGAITVAWFLLPVIRQLLMFAIGLAAPIELVADAHTRTELARNGLDPAGLEPSLIKVIAQHALEISRTPVGVVNRTELASNIAALASIAGRARRGALEGEGEVAIWEGLIRRGSPTAPDYRTQGVD
ncbi:MAG TPA: hypothetical protein VGH13_04440 [Xanthobacteraceae bacterium]|jgi:hypothetical protein